MSQHAVNASDYQGKTEKITDPARVMGLLLRAIEGRALLAVGLPDSMQSYNSALLKLRPERGYLELDEFKPRPEQSPVAKKIHVSTRLNGVEISFTTRIESMDQSSGIALYLAKLPTSMNYLQRRSHYRASVSLARTLPVFLMLENGDRIEGRLRDISTSGIGASFPHDLPESVVDSRYAQDCSIALPTGETIDCLIEICFVNRSLYDNARVVGARFVRLGPLQQSIVARFVTALDRESMKKRTTRK